MSSSNQSSSNESIENNRISPKIDSNDIDFRTIHKGSLIKNDGKFWNHVEQPVKTHVLDLIEKQLSTFQNSDIQVIIDESIFSCHSILLQSYSGYFNQLSLNTSEIILPSERVNSSSFIKIYEWMLADKPKIERPGIMELYVAAKFLKIENLILQIYGCFDNLECFSEDLAFVLYWEARSVNETEILALAMPRIKKFFLTMVATTEFLEMNFQEICEFLKMGSIGVRRETDVFFSGLTWLYHDWEDREKYVMDIMKCVRFVLMRPWELTELRNDNKSIEVENITKMPTVGKMIDNALSLVSMRCYSPDYSDGEVLKMMEKLKIESRAERYWIKDVGPPEIPNSEVNRYEDFLDYLRMICSEENIYWTSLEAVGFEIKSDPSPEIQKYEELLLITTQEPSPEIQKYEEPLLITHQEVINPKIFIFGGSNPHEKEPVNSGRFVYEYNPTTNSYKIIAELPEPRQHHSVVMLRGIMYVAGGTNPYKNSEIVLTMWSFNPRNLSWRIEPDIPVAIRDFGFVANDEKLYIFGGETKDNEILSSLFSFDPLTNRWTELNQMKVPRAGLSTVQYQDNIIVAGGIISKQENCSNVTKSVEFYDIKGNGWYFLDTLRIPRCYAKMCMIGKNVFIIAGAGEGTDGHISSLDSFDVYDVKNGYWRLKDYCLERHGHDVVVLSGNIFIFGGISSVLEDAVDIAECYNFLDDCMVNDVDNLPTKLSGLACISYDASCNEI